MEGTVAPSANPQALTALSYIRRLNLVQPENILRKATDERHRACALE